MAAFLAGWAMQRWLTPFSTSPGSEKSVSSVTHQRNMGMGQGQGFQRMVNTLELNQKQTNDFSEIESLYRNKMHDYMQQLDSIDLALLDELKKENPNILKLDSLAAEAGRIQTRLKKTTAHHFLAIKKLCNPEQKERFNKIIKDLNKFKRGQGHGPGYGRRGQGRGRNFCN